MLTVLTQSGLSCVVLGPGRRWRVGRNWANPSQQKLQVTFGTGASQIPLFGTVYVDSRSAPALSLAAEPALVGCLNKTKGKYCLRPSQHLCHAFSIWHSIKSIYFFPFPKGERKTGLLRPERFGEANEGARHSEHSFNGHFLLSRLREQQLMIRLIQTGGLLNPYLLSYI